LVSVGFVAAVILVAVGCYPAIHPDNRPTSIAGARNGELAPSQLVTISSTCAFYWKAAPYYQAMVRDAAAAGVSLGATECYRTLAGQQEVRNYWCSFGLCHFAAVPGTSIHGWGKAVDLHDGSGGLAFSSTTFAWLEDNAWRYGFNHPGWAAEDGSAPEPWHWEWVADGGTMFPGQTIPPPT